MQKECITYFSEEEAKQASLGLHHRVVGESEYVHHVCVDQSLAIDLAMAAFTHVLIWAPFLG